MTIEYIKNLNRSYLIIKDVKAALSSFDVQMAMRRKSASFLPMECIMADGRAECWYDITGRQPFEVVLECQKADMRFLTQFVGSLAKASQNTEDYLLDGACISFCPQCIFYDVVQKEYLFCYVPGYEVDNGGELRTLTELILRHLDHGDDRAVSAGYALYQKVTEDIYSMQDLVQCLGHDLECEMRSEEWQETYEEEDEPDMPNEEGHKITGSTLSRLWGKMQQRIKNEDFRYEEKRREKLRKNGEKPGIRMGAFRGMSEQKTVFLSAPSDEIQGQLLYQGQNGQDHLLVDTGQDNYFIGSNIEAVDGYIRNENVSRIHARIFKLKGEFYVEDLNSTNGTTLNGKAIVYRQKEKLNKNDRLVFATEEYLFC